MSSQKRLLKKRIVEIEREISEKTREYEVAKNNMISAASEAEFYSKQIIDLQSAKRKLQKEIPL